MAVPKHKKYKIVIKNCTLKKLQSQSHLIKKKSISFFNNYFFLKILSNLSYNFFEKKKNYLNTGYSHLKFFFFYSCLIYKQNEKPQNYLNFYLEELDLIKIKDKFNLELFFLNEQHCLLQSYSFYYLI